MLQNVPKGMMPPHLVQQMLTEVTRRVQASKLREALHAEKEKHHPDPALIRHLQDELWKLFPECVSLKHRFLRNTRKPSLRERMERIPNCFVIRGGYHEPKFR